MLKFRKFMIQSEADDLLGGGGSGGNPEQGKDQPGQEQGKPAPSKVTLPENWKEALDPEILDHPSIKSIKDVQALAKSYIHGQKLIGADKIVVPSNLTTDEEWKGIFKKLGVPESPDKYEFKVAGQASDEFVNKFKALAVDTGILPKAAEKLFEFFEAESQAMIQENENSSKAAFEETVKGLKKEWGQAYERKLSNAAGLFGQYADEETKAFMKESGFNNHPLVLRMMSKIADAFGEDKFVAPGGNGAMGMTPQEAEAKIKSIYADPNHAYFHKNHPKNSEARAEMARLQQAKIARK